MQATGSSTAATRASSAGKQPSRWEGRTQRSDGKVAFYLPPENENSPRVTPFEKRASMPLKFLAGVGLAVAVCDSDV